jgi:glycolate oxidase
MSQTRRQKLASQFREILASDSVAYECDGLSAYREQPLLVLLPENIEQVQQVMRLCHQLRLPVVSRGAGTSLSGGALPHAEGVVLSLAKMSRILQVDRLSRLAVVEPGVRNLAISEAVSSLGLYYAPDPSSQIACSIGGNVAENAGGVHCLKYGLTLHNILALKLVSAEGEIFELDQRSLSADGYDLLPLLVGSEGMLGIVVEVTVYCRGNYSGRHRNDGQSGDQGCRRLCACGVSDRGRSDPDMRTRWHGRRSAGANRAGGKRPQKGRCDRNPARQG